MAQEGFKHISVTPPDDDFVINAGVVKEPAYNSQAEEAESGGAANADTAEIPEVSKDSGSREGDALCDDSSAVDSAAESVEEVKAERPAKRRAADGEEFQETTLQDLQGEPMPFTQKVVIIAAVVCIIGALAYYFICMS